MFLVDIGTSFNFLCKLVKKNKVKILIFSFLLVSTCLVSILLNSLTYEYTVTPKINIIMTHVSNITHQKSFYNQHFEINKTTNMVIISNITYPSLPNIQKKIIEIRFTAINISNLTSIFLEWRYQGQGNISKIALFTSDWKTVMVIKDPPESYSIKLKPDDSKRKLLASTTKFIMLIEYADKSKLPNSTGESLYFNILFEIPQKIIKRVWRHMITICYFVIMLLLTVVNMNKIEKLIDTLLRNELFLIFIFLVSLNIIPLFLITIYKESTNNTVYNNISLFWQIIIAIAATLSLLILYFIFYNKLTHEHIIKNSYNNKNVEKLCKKYIIIATYILTFSLIPILIYIRYLVKYQYIGWDIPIYAYSEKLLVDGQYELFFELRKDSFLYFILVALISLSTNFDPLYVEKFMTVILFILFLSAFYLMSARIENDKIFSLFVLIMTVLWPSMYRLTIDLRRNTFAFIVMIILFSILIKQNFEENLGIKEYILIEFLYTIIILTHIYLGMLIYVILLLYLITCLLLQKRKTNYKSLLIIVGILTITLMPFYNVIIDILGNIFGNIRIAVNSQHASTNLSIRNLEIVGLYNLTAINNFLFYGLGANLVYLYLLGFIIYTYERKRIDLLSFWTIFHLIGLLIAVLYNVSLLSLYLNRMLMLTQFPIFSGYFLYKTYKLLEEFLISYTYQKKGSYNLFKRSIKKIKVVLIFFILFTPIMLNGYPVQRTINKFYRSYISSNLIDQLERTSKILKNRNLTFVICKKQEIDRYGIEYLRYIDAWLGSFFGSHVLYIGILSFFVYGSFMTLHDYDKYMVYFYNYLNYFKIPYNNTHFNLKILLNKTDVIILSELYNPALFFKNPELDYLIKIDDGIYILNETKVLKNLDMGTIPITLPLSFYDYTTKKVKLVSTNNSIFFYFDVIKSKLNITFRIPLIHSTNINTLRIMLYLPFLDKYSIHNIHYNISATLEHMLFDKAIKNNDILIFYFADLTITNSVQFLNINIIINPFRDRVVSPYLGPLSIYFIHIT